MESLIFNNNSKMAKRQGPSPGLVRVCQQRRGCGYPDVEGYVNIPAWSRGAEPWKQLSPFRIGPIEGCSNFESWWQSFKVWETVEEQHGPEWKWPAERHVDEGGTAPNEAWQKWHDALLANKSAVRRPNGWRLPLYAWYKGQKLDVVQARQQIYIFHLQQLYRAHPVYLKLLALVRGGQSVIIIEPDGPPHANGLEMTLDWLTSRQSVTRQVDAYPDLAGLLDERKYFPYGHGYVLALTLLQDLQAEGEN